MDDREQPGSPDAPFRALTPDAVLDALAGAGLAGDGRLLQLNSYENRVFQASLDDGRFVVAKFYRPARWSEAQILEEHAFAIELAEAEVPVVAPLALQAVERSPMPIAASGSPPTLGRMPAAAGGYRFGVSPRRGGRSPEADDGPTLRRIGRFIGRLHAVGARRAFVHRQSLDVLRMGRGAVDRLIARDLFTPSESPAWRDAAERALDAVDAAFAEVGATRILRLHGDCHRANILWRDAEGDEGPHFVDLDDACNGPAVQDLWMLLGGDAEAISRQLGHLLAGYRSFVDFDVRELALIEPLRTLRMIHYSAWIADRWNDPAFPAAFTWFGSAAYWSQQTLQLREQLEAMAEPPPRPFDPD